MNRYQLEVAEMDRRHRLVVRSLSFVGACCLAVLALWSAGLPPTQWLAATQGLWDRLSEQPIASSVSEPVGRVARPTAGAAAAGMNAQAGTDSSTSATPLPLYLVATTPGRNKHEGIARIGTSLENPQTYVAGALLANGSRLSEIHADRVVLSRDGTSAELYIHGHAAEDKRPRSVVLLTIGPQPSAAPAVAKVGEGLTDYVRPSPVYDGELLRGYEVYPGSKSAVFARLGLQPGDLVTSINDAPLNEPSQAMELFGQIMRGVAVAATIERSRVQKRITIDGLLISADQESTKEAAAAMASAAPLNH